MNKKFISGTIAYVLLGVIIIALGATKSVSEGLAIGVLAVATVGFVGFVTWWMIRRKQIVKEALYGNNAQNIHSVAPTTQEECLAKLDKMGFEVARFGRVSCCVDEYGNHIAFAQSEEALRDLAQYQEGIQKFCNAKRGHTNAMGYTLYLFMDEQLTEETVKLCLKGIHERFGMCFFAGYALETSKLYYVKGLEDVCTIMGWHYLRNVPDMMNKLFGC
ncbi:MAG: hypothetical protein ACRCTE_01170 [Cellulosilyticaceae bacterium]